MAKLYAECGALYLGCASPVKVAAGLDAIQDPLKVLYPKNLQAIRAIDVNLQMFCSGLRVQADGSKYELWHSIRNLYVAAAVKHDPSKTVSGLSFVPLDHPGLPKSEQPPVFGALFRSTSGDIECHAFICRRSMDAQRMVNACIAAYKHEDGWDLRPPPFNDVAGKPQNLDYENLAEKAAEERNSVDKEFSDLSVADSSKGRREESEGNLSFSRRASTSNSTSIKDTVSSISSAPRKARKPKGLERNSMNASTNSIYQPHDDSVSNDSGQIPPYIPHMMMPPFMPYYPYPNPYISSESYQQQFMHYPPSQYLPFYYPRPIDYQNRPPKVGDKPDHRVARPIPRMARRHIEHKDTESKNDDNEKVRHLVNDFDNLSMEEVSAHHENHQ